MELTETESLDWGDWVGSRRGGVSQFVDGGVREVLLLILGVVGVVAGCS